LKGKKEVVRAEIEERFLHCASRRVRRKRTRKKRRRLAPVGMTV